MILTVIVLISGNGSNLQALIDDTQKSRRNYKVVAVISNNADAYGLKRARKAQIKTHVIDHRDYLTREDFDQELIKQIDQYNPDLIVLAGFMRILSDEFVNHYRFRLLNIHPSLLPKYKGLDTHQRVLDNKDITHGCSVHLVTEELDGGPVLIQGQFELKDNENQKTLIEKVHRLEHIIYPQLINLVADKRLDLKTLQLDGKVLSRPILVK